MELGEWTGDGALEDFDESDEFEAEGELSLSFGTEGSGEEGGAEFGWDSFAKGGSFKESSEFSVRESSKEL